MNFINADIDVNTLPAAEDIPLQGIQPAYKKIFLVEWMITTVLLLATAVILYFLVYWLRSFQGIAILAASLLFICIFYYTGIQKSFPFYAYAIREKDVVYQRGWIFRRVKICPFNRIQNCSVVSGPLERKYRLASLIIYTAGTNGADMRIPGLLQEEADRLRYFILQQIHAEPNEAV